MCNRDEQALVSCVCVRESVICLSKIIDGKVITHQTKHIAAKSYHAHGDCVTLAILWWT